MVGTVILFFFWPTRMNHLIFLESLPGYDNVKLVFSSPPTGAEIFQSVCNMYPSSTPLSSCLSSIAYFTNETHVLQPDDLLSVRTSILRFHFKLPGGKQGAFGQKLKKAKATRKKIVSLSKCKDLSGRRISDLKIAKLLAEWEEKHGHDPIPQEQLEAERRRFLRNRAPKVDLTEFEEKRKESLTGLEEALEDAFTDEHDEETDEGDSGEKTTEKQKEVEVSPSPYPSSSSSSKDSSLSFDMYSFI